MAVPVDPSRDYRSRQGDEGRLRLKPLDEPTCIHSGAARVSVDVADCASAWTAPLSQRLGECPATSAATRLIKRPGQGTRRRTLDVFFDGNWVRVSGIISVEPWDERVGGIPRYARALWRRSLIQFVTSSESPNQAASPLTLITTRSSVRCAGGARHEPGQRSPVRPRAMRT